MESSRSIPQSRLIVVRVGTVLADAPTKTANQRRLTLDTATLAVAQRERAEREEFGPWMFSVGDNPPNPDRIGYWRQIARDKVGLDAKRRLHDYSDLRVMPISA